MSITAHILKSLEPENKKAPWLPMVRIDGFWRHLNNGCKTFEDATAFIDRWAAQRGLDIEMQS